MTYERFNEIAIKIAERGLAGIIFALVVYAFFINIEIRDMLMGLFGLLLIIGVSFIVGFVASLFFLVRAITLYFENKNKQFFQP